eukprot:TRINITY_DN45052_c0_g2_i10.p1 TRINITY_DN45052_c0_g2~~TRINITY_DN45052_c0_g2_i10.p1  ORF type:complete len:213 (-),score=29.79 TRINITY_DN45052_c0_g2_i10:248-886(-)
MAFTSAWGLLRPHILKSYGNNMPKKTHRSYLARLARRQLKERFGHHLHIFTDGSVLETEEAGCAVVIPSFSITKRYKLNKGVNSFTAELYAIRMACETVNDMSETPQDVVIVTDSLASLKALETGPTGSRREIQAKILSLADKIIRKGTNLTLMWVPSHSGISGNEMADEAAKAATENGFPTYLRLSRREADRHLLMRRRGAGPTTSKCTTC